MLGASELLEHFGHYFELMAGANAAFSLTNKFTKYLVTKIATPFSKLKSDLPILQGTIKQTEKLFIDNSEGIMKKVDVETKIGLKAKLKDLSDKIDADKSEGEQIKTDYKAHIDSYQTKKFNYLCLLSMFYSIAILLLIGFQINSSFVADSILSYNILLIIFLGCYLKLFKKYTNPSYVKVTVFCLAIGVVVFFVCWILFKLHIKCPKDLSLLFQLSCLIVPIKHFIYTLYVAIVKAIPDGNAMQKRYYALQRKHEQVKQEVIMFFSIVNDIAPQTDTPAIAPPMA